MPSHPSRLSDSPFPARRHVLRSAALFAAVLPLAACAATEDPLAEQAKAGNGKNYIAGDGSVQEYDQASRGKPVELDGTTYEGKTIDSAQLKDQITVLNFWYAACAPCRLEAPHLAKLSKAFKSKGVQFYGVNVRDGQDTAHAFERTFKIDYPSMPDADGSILLSMTEYVPPQAVPTTLVLDRQGRVAARLLGEADESTLKALISDLVSESA
ncbi:MAG: TlpA family protein disulfide reductase [Arthrobacter sp.]|uniref:TlpA family protein disulfide reductase n=1 Tax=unclassified Arthrobacter TaxID=235627 RepID=UPI00264B468C|nr:TlpA family protein disulfide reductase [Micrococcaceae bacterium]MDN5813108.1 TlpA family protein disulfide reductase [Micrococcaceae bacterium]MDN5824518.1 TlpA family protein disulfide reductase [Micrococcaceae bacterium]MDN5878506.1 TlpA family protein disulfide reductase [Micrococcaceae bacterium]MDN5885438.1 TlpA family protein disulfide reductase [Micrococcaceae bacterium]